MFVHRKGRSPGVRRLLAALFLVASTAVVMTAATGAAASADTGKSAPAKPTGGFGPVATQGLFTNSVDTAGAGVHTCLVNTCTALEVNQPYTPLRDFCFGQGQTLGGTPWWDLVYNPATGRAGWTNEHWLSNESQGQNCNTANTVYPTGTASQPGTGIHSCRSNTCTALGFANGHSIVAFCYTDGQLLGGNVWWDLVYDRNTGVAGWTNEFWLTAHAATHC